MKHHFFSITLEDNIQTLQAAIRQINTFYRQPDFTIVCPSRSLSVFQTKFSIFRNVNIVSEDTILSYQEYLRLAHEICGSVDATIDLKKPLGWYYQQVLKLSFLVQNAEVGVGYVMWDADSIPLSRIDFFCDNEALLYGSAIEFHTPYFDTLRVLYGALPDHFYAFTVQFFNCTKDDAVFMERYFLAVVPSSPDTSHGQWITKVMVTSIFKRHQTLHGQLFSEQECVGLGSLLRHPRKQRIIPHLRLDYQGCLTSTQLRLATFLGFKHITYENPNAVWGRTQGWLTLFYWLMKEVLRQQFGIRALGIQRKKK